MLLSFPCFLFKLILIPFYANLKYVLKKTETQNVKLQNLCSTYFVNKIATSKAQFLDEICKLSKEVVVVDQNPTW